MNLAKQMLAAEKTTGKMLGNNLAQARGASTTALDQSIKAREEVAELRGRLQTLHEQNTELLKLLPIPGK